MSRFIQSSARRRATAVLTLAVVVVGGAVPAGAHGFGQRYDLPLPLGLFMGSAAAVVALSFLLLSVFAVRPRPLLRADALRATSAPADQPVSAPAGLGGLLVIACRAAGFAVFLLVIAAGLFGNPDPFKNLAPVSVWVIGWVGLAFASAVLGDVWRLLNPFDTGFRLIEAAVGRGRRTRPYRLGRWPAVGLFLAFAWAELVWPDRDRPGTLALAIIGYTLVTWAGMWVYGRRAWGEGGEVFTAVFRLIARFAPLAAESGRLRPRLPGAGLLARAAEAWSTTALVLLLLSSVTFDGLLETPPWAALTETALAAAWFSDFASALDVDPYVLLCSMALILFPLLFGGLYLAVAGAMAWAARRCGTGARTGEVARQFVLTLVPIAIAYHVAHYLAYFLIAGQFVIPLLSDPFGWGWNLFGTRLYLLDIGVIDARTTWHAALGLIVGGHVIAVVLAHFQAEQFFPRRAVLASQLPMLALMVGYTASSLWILAQPITEVTAG